MVLLGSVQEIQYNLDSTGKPTQVSQSVYTNGQVGYINDDIAIHKVWLRRITRIVGI